MNEPDANLIDAIQSDRNIQNSTFTENGELRRYAVESSDGFWQVSYTFPSAASALEGNGYDTTISDGNPVNLEFANFVDTSLIQKGAINQILQADDQLTPYSVYFSDVAKIDFNFTPDANEAAIKFSQVALPQEPQFNGVGGYSFLFGNEDEGDAPEIPGFQTEYLPESRADIWLNVNALNAEDVPRWANIDEGGLAFRTLIHEIGHSVGLSHTFTDDNQTSKDHPDGPGSGYFEDTRLDNVKYSIMTDTAQGLDHPEMAAGLLPAGLQILDIAALQDLYGKDEVTRLGDTLYDGNGAFESSFREDAFIYTIWDAGGDADEISALGYGADTVTTGMGAQIDLRAGHFSSIGYTGEGDGRVVAWDTVDATTGEITYDAGNVAIAYDVVIENASGSNFNDELIGNEFNNRLQGNGGDDTLTGGEGHDTFIWSRGDDNDTITDYVALDGDILRLSGGDITLDDLSFSRAGFGEDFRSVRITIDGVEGGEIVVQGLLDVFSNPSDSVTRQPLLNVDIENPDGTVAEKTILLTTSGTIALDSQGNPQIFDRIAPEEDGNLNIDLLNGVKTAVFTSEGDDLIINNTSANIIATGNGNDVVEGISAGDFIYFGGGIDTLDLSATTTDISANFTSLQIDGTTITLGSTISGLTGSLENITLGSGNDTARSSPGRVIDGGEGTDTVFSTSELVITDDGTIFSEGSRGGDSHFTNFETVSLSDGVYSEALGITYDGVSTRQFFDYSEIGHGIRFEQTGNNEITVSDITGTNLAQDTIVVENFGTPFSLSSLIAGTDNDDEFIFNQNSSTFSGSIWLGNGDDTVELASTAFGASEYIYTGGNDRFIVEDVPSFGGRPEIIFAIDGLTQSEISVDINGTDFLYTIGGHGTILIEGIGNSITLTNPDEIKVVGATPQDDVIIAADLPSSSPFNVNVYGGELFNDGGSGNDFIDYSGGNFAVRTLYGRTGDDTLIDGDQENDLFGGTGNDILVGNGGDDTILGGDGDDILQGGAGNDTLRGGFGNDTYVFAAGDGFDTIDDIYGTNILRVEGNLNPQDFVYSRIGDDLQIDIASGVIIEGYFANEDTIETIVIDDGATFDLRDLIAGGREEVAPELINENGNVTATIETVEDAYDFVPEPQVFPDLVERARLDPDLVNGANRQNLTFSDDRQLDIRFVEEGAGYKNSLGMYTVAADGTLENVQLLAENLSGTGNGVFGGGDFNAGDLLASMEVEAGTEIGFFIIANGFNRNKGFKRFDTENGTFEFRTRRNGDLSEIDDGKAKLFFIDDATGKEFKVKGDVWHASSTSLNRDGEMHAVTGELEEGTLTLGFEDLRNLGDADYNDVVIEIEVSPTTTFMLDPVAVAPDLTVLDEDDGMLSEVMIELDSGFQSGDLLTIDESLLDGTNINFSQTSDTSILLTGNEDAAIYQEIINSLMFNNLTERPEDGERNINITVTDVDGLMDSTDITVEISLDSNQDLQISDVLHTEDALIFEAGSEVDQLTPDMPQPFVQADNSIDDITQQPIGEFG